MCMADYIIGTKIAGVGQQVTTDVTLRPNPYRWGFVLFSGDFTGQVRVFAGTDNTGIPLGACCQPGGQSMVKVTRLEAGQLVTGPLYFNGNGGSIYGVVELILSNEINQLITAGKL